MKKGDTTNPHMPWCREGVTYPKSPKFRKVFILVFVKRAGMYLDFSAATSDFFRNIPVCIVKENAHCHIVFRWVVDKFGKMEFFNKMLKKREMCHFSL